MDLPHCLSCAVVANRKETLGGPIIETESFHAHQDAAYPIPGLVILASKRHVKCLDELSEVEALQFISLSRRIRSAQRKILGIEHVYYFYNEDTTHHFHLWLVPRYAWMYSCGRSVESLRPALVHARDRMNSSEQLAECARGVAALRDELHVSGTEGSNPTFQRTATRPLN